MRKWTELTLIILVSCIVQIAWVEGEDKNAARDQARQSAESRQVQGITNALSAIEKFWPQQPELYFRSMNEVARRTVSGLTNAPDTRQALRAAFTNMIQKTILTNEDETPALRLKRDAILGCLGLDEIRNDTATWLAIAKYIGELRSRIITDYKKKGFANPPGLMGGSPEKVQQIIQKNERNKAIDRLQQELRQTDRILTLFLLHNAGRLVGDADKRKAYIQEIKSLAHLREEEQLQL